MIAGDATRHFADNHDHVVGAFIGGFLWCSIHLCVNNVGQEDNQAGGGSQFGGSDALSDLVHVATFGLKETSMCRQTLLAVRPGNPLRYPGLRARISVNMMGKFKHA